MITNSDIHQQLGKFLELTAEELDVPEAMYRDAKEKYEHLGMWLKSDHEARFQSNAEIYSQGSTRLGTAIRPVKKDDEYDVDLVYRRDVQRTSLTQEKLKDQVGNQLERYLILLSREGKEVPKLVSGRRCWTLEYTGKFHMDILPAVPDEDSHLHFLRDLDDAIAITDKRLLRWQYSNPRGYAHWFEDQEQALLLERRTLMAKTAEVDIEDFPVERVRTPLRQTIQILKRHRDIRYQGNSDDKPISIIITTLAANAYNNQANLYDALMAIIPGMRDSIKISNGEYWVANPISRSENFADKWKEEPQRAIRFLEWLDKLESDLSSASNQRGLHKIAESLSPAMGESTIQRVLKRFGQDMDTQHQRGRLRMAAKTGTLGEIGTIVKKNTWYGT